MKNAALALMLLLGVLARAEEPAYTGGCEDSVGAYTTTLNAVSPTVESAAIDMASIASMFVKTTGSASTLVGYEFSDTSTFVGADKVLFPRHGSFCLTKRGRYLRLYASGVQSGTVTAKTAPGTGPSVSIGGSSAGIALPVAITSTVGLQGTSLTTRDILTQTASPLDITVLAGVTANCVVCLSVHGGGSGVGALFHTGASSPIDVRNFGHPIALSANAQCWGPFVPGMKVSLQGQGASDDVVTVDIQQVK